MGIHLYWGLLQCWIWFRLQLSTMGTRNVPCCLLALVVSCKYSCDSWLGNRKLYPTTTHHTIEFFCPWFTTYNHSIHHCSPFEALSDDPSGLNHQLNSWRLNSYQTSWTLLWYPLPTWVWTYRLSALRLDPFADLSDWAPGAITGDETVAHLRNRLTLQIADVWHRRCQAHQVSGPTMGHLLVEPRPVDVGRCWIVVAWWQKAIRITGWYHCGGCLAQGGSVDLV